MIINIAGLSGNPYVLFDFARGNANSASPLCSSLVDFKMISMALEFQSQHFLKMFCSYAEYTFITLKDIRHIQAIHST